MCRVGFVQCYVPHLNELLHQDIPDEELQAKIPHLRDLAATTVNTDITRYQVGCAVVRAMDLIRDLVSLHAERRRLMGLITKPRQEGQPSGYSDQCHAVFNNFLAAIAAERGCPPPGIVEFRSIVNLTIHELIALGETFSSRPSALDSTVADFWTSPPPAVPALANCTSLLHYLSAFLLTY